MKKKNKKLKKRTGGSALAEKKKRRITAPRSSQLFDTIRGVIDGTSRGYAFLIPEEGGGDIFIPASDLMGAIHGDTVEIVKTSEHRGSGEGRVVKIISSPNSTFVGTVAGGFVEPDLSGMPQKIKIEKNASVSFSQGDKVVARIIKYGRDCSCRVVEKLGLSGNTDVEVLSVIRSYKINEHFSPRVLREADRLDDEITPEMSLEREDFTADDVITIDGAHSKDFDDAICVKRKGKGYRLFVHIADVSEYVKHNMAIDKEAYDRGTSVYFSDRVIPMLPERLCNDLCSLVEGEKRLTLSCVMDINSEGEVVSSRVVEGIIRSKARTTYDQIFAFMQGDAEMRERFAHLSDMLEAAIELYGILEKKRIASGSIEFDLPECEIEVDETGKVINVRVLERNAAHKLIEEFMLIANKTVAKTFCQRKVPFVYRVHAAPPEEKEQTLREFLKQFNIALPEKITPPDIADMLKKIEPRLLETVNMVTLRSMSKAEYKPQNDGHFGLNFVDYCHFTSPIRRYPDLAIHRIIKAFIRGGKQNVDQFRDWVGEVSLHSSKAERTAEEAERKVDDLLKAKFMEDKIGLRFPATVSGVTDWSLFARLDNGIEGSIRVETLGRHYEFNPTAFCLSSGSSSFRIGDKINIEVVAVEGSRVIFELKEEE